MKNLVVITGAGMSAESGLKTFRGSDGLWEGYDVMSVASIDGFRSNPSLVYEFYNARRRQLKTVKPNPCHRFLSELQQEYKVNIITQNVDDLHERGGSKDILHLHGELLKVRTLNHPSIIYEWSDDLNAEDLSPDGHRLRPHIVWFGEEVPLIQRAGDICSQADICMIIGTSLQVYPAAGLIDYLPSNTPIIYVDPMPSANHSLLNQHSFLTTIEDTAVNAIPRIRNILRKLKT
ncbi:SIR2 family NAD-dependent protein deacylase [Membranihabitans marinus]|uniref:SIR2 family NAD-dependent protein deacylase n=1 Tax=Membranihabitans marinus TaxID=1227546 RepID=UPI001F1A128C|nr:Sir2 family NAD-dependent protein deacetylase [Membranihabitans marinus]